jgi:hypothetical protein
MNKKKIEKDISYYRLTLKKDFLDYIFTRIKLLT